MSEDIVRWLRGRVWTDDPSKLDEAADYIEHQIASHEAMTLEIERLRADCAKLETAHGQNMREISRLRAERAAARETLAFVLDRIKRINFLAGLDEPIREQTAMAKDAIDAALKGGEDD